MKAFRTMKEAADAAEKLCLTWLVNDGNTVDAQGLEMLAAALDEEMKNSGKTPAAFLCSKEGALGVTFDFEYNAQWVCYPLPDEENLEEEVLSDLEKRLMGLEQLTTEEIAQIWNPQ